MAEDESTFDDFEGRRDYLRVGLVVVSLLAILLATTAIPVLSPAGTDAPASELVPIPEELRDSSGGSAGGGPGTSGGLGALSPQEETSVGGSLGGESALRSQSDEVHFRVESTDPVYMRTGAYGEYTGDGWKQRDETTPIDGSIPVEGQRGTEVTYEVTLERSASALPTVWQPAELSREGGVVTANGAVRPERTVPEGTSYTGVSYRPPDESSVLEQAGQEYPSAIEERYTQLPTESDGRLSGFTDELTANASTAYEQARVIEQWLEANKEYSLSASHDQDSDVGVASQFVFEMETGYCEYFATSMVAMLRSQDIPARYVVGYSTGEEVSEDSYVVRGMNAHAWVEVYFPDVGWVRFDPTPGNERRQQEAEQLGQSTPTPTPTPTETPTTPSNDTQTETENDGYQITLNRTAVPGQMVTVSVTDDGDPVADVRVLFNGEHVGTTAAAGNVTAQVPYESTLTVTIDDTLNERVASYGAPTRENGRLLQVANPATVDNETYELNTTARLVLTGSVHTGSAVQVTALVDGAPIQEGNITIDGTRVAVTDPQGQATITLPSEPGETTIAVERGAVSGNRTVTLDELRATVAPTAPLALPLTAVRVNATMAGEPVSGATVTLGGEAVATTGVDGTATVTLPLDASAVVGVSRFGQQRVARITGLYTNLGIVAGGGVVAALLVGLFARSRAVGPRSVGRWLARASRWAVAALIVTARGLDRALTRLTRRIVLTARHLRGALAGQTALSTLAAALRAWFDARIAGIGTVVSAWFGSVARVAGNGDEPPDDAHATIREGWSEFLDHVSLATPERRTPESIAAHAIEVDELPAAAVWTLVDAFRAVEYGQREPTEQVPAIDGALADVERALERAEAADGDSDRTGGEPGVAD